MRFLLIFLSFSMMFSCATIMRKDMHTQKLIVRDSESKKRIPNVKVQVDGTDIGYTNQKGMINFPVEQKNESDGYLLTLTSDGYVPVKIKIKNAVSGGYLVGDIALFLLGIIPGVVGLVVDAVTGEWYSYQDIVVIDMHHAK